MIAVTRLDGVRILLNDELIETIEQTPDTLVSLLNGHQLIVRETPDDLVQRTIAFKRLIGGLTGSGDARQTVTPVPLAWDPR